MAAKFSDKEINDLIQEKKRVSVNFWKQINLRTKRSHKEQEIDLLGDKESRFRLILRENKMNALDFSIILAHYPSDTNQLFRLRRYNGKSHQHTNRLEGETFYNFHIHLATERYQERGYREDAFAIITDKYSNIMGAIECMIRDCKLVLPEQCRRGLFEENGYDT